MAQPTYTLFGTIAPSLAEHSMFEQFVIVGLPPTYKIECQRHNETQIHDPQILYLYPPGKPLMNTMIPHFCFPNGLKSVASLRAHSASNLNSVLFSPMAQLEEPRNSFVFLLTGDTTVYYGVCILKLETLDGDSSFFNVPSESNPSCRYDPRDLSGGFDISVPRVYCLISRFPFIKMHFEVLISVLERERMFMFAGYELGIPSSLSLIEYYHQLKRNGVDPNISLSLPGNSRAPSVFYCPEDDHGRQLAEWGTFNVLNKLEQEDILLVCSYLLQEQSILVTSNALGLLSSFLFTILSLLKPFLWECALVPILPKKLWESVDTPIPFFIGVCDPSPKLVEGEHDYLIVDLDHNRVIRPTKYVPMFPRWKRLSSIVSQHKQQYHELQHAPLQHRRVKLVEDVLASFRENNSWIVEEVTRAVLAVFENGKNKSSRDLPAVNFLDDEENMAHVISCFAEEHQAFFTNFLRTQLFSVHSQQLYNRIAESAVGKDQEMLGMLTQLILMEEKSREVLQDYGRGGIARLSPGLSKALNETESILAALKLSKEKLEEDVSKKKKRNPILARFGSLGNDTVRKVIHRRTRSVSEQVEKRILIHPLAPFNTIDSPNTVRRRSVSTAPPPPASHVTNSS